MAAVSIFDIFKIGIGPSSSHTVGPMKSAREFAMAIEDHDVASIEVRLHGSLAWTGKGHGTDSAVILGLCGLEPETIDTFDIVDVVRIEVADVRQITLGPTAEADFPLIVGLA